MNVAAIFIVYFGIKETLFHKDTGAWRGQYESRADVNAPVNPNKILLEQTFKCLSVSNDTQNR